MSNSNREHVGGFSCIQLLSSLTLISTLALVGFHGTRHLQTRLTIQAGLTEITDYLAATQHMAIREQRTRQVTFIPPRTLTPVVDEGSPSRALPLQLSPALTIETFSFSGAKDRITFYPSGTASPGHLSIRAHEHTCTVIQSLLGARRHTCD